MKVFISQPMKGLTDDEIKANRKKAIDLITLKYNGDVEFIDSFIEGNVPKLIILPHIILVSLLK